jgi:hypothetical protein
MKFNFKNTILLKGIVVKFRALAVVAGLLMATSSFSATITVASQSDIFRAGGNNPALDGVDPLTNSFTAGANQVLTFQSVTGSWSCCSGGASFNGPDGATFAAPSTNINSSNKIAGIVDGARTMFLVGLFLDTGLPAAAPARLDFSPGQLTESFATLAPLLGQVFFIGDGLTGTGAGSTQQFLVPTTATRLFLGIADGFGFSGNPGAYGDNVGSVSATFTIASNNNNNAPEPGPVSLLALGVVALGWARSRRQQNA